MGFGNEVWLILPKNNNTSCDIAQPGKIYKQESPGDSDCHSYLVKDTVRVNACDMNFPGEQTFTHSGICILIVNTFMYDF